MAGINRFYYPTKFSSRIEAISKGVQCVFIAHQKQDKEASKKVAEYLQNAGIDVYFDEFDKDLKIHHQSGNAQEVTKAICKGINNSSHMLVVVSPNTLLSTWVPFEIGYGYDKTDLGVLCLKGINKGGLPEYARSAKIVRDIYDLNFFVRALTGRSNEFLVENKMMSDYGSSYNPLANVMDSMISDQY